MDSLIDPQSVVVINLDHYPQKLEAFRRYNAHLGPVRHYSAVFGAGQDRTQLEANGVIAGDIGYTDGALGCALSHFGLWQQIAEGSRPLTICEDDAIFAPDFLATANALVAALPDGWDIVLWGWNFDSLLVFEMLPGRTACLTHGPGSETAEDLAAAADAPASAHLFRLHRACGTLGYTISAKGAAALLAHCRPLRPLTTFVPEMRTSLPNCGIDMMMSDAYPQMRAYVSIPPLAISPNVNGHSTTLEADAVGLLRKIGRISLDRLAAALDLEGANTDPCTKARFFKTWIDANPASPSLFLGWYYMGRELRRGADHKRAIAAYRTALFHKPDFEPASTELGLALSCMVSTPEAR